MEGVPAEIADFILLKQIIFTMIGIACCFLGLWIYKSTVAVIGFVVGMLSGAYLIFVLFNQVAVVEGLENWKYLILVLLTLVMGGIIGMYLAKMFQYVIFFLAGGVIALIVFRLWTGNVEITDFSTFESFRNAMTENPPKAWEIVAFCTGGLLYMINIGPIVAVTTATLGAFMLRWTWFDVLTDLGPQVADIGALVMIVLGASIQLTLFRGRMDMLPGRFRR